MAARKKIAAIRSKRNTRQSVSRGRKNPIESLHGILKRGGPSTKELLKWRRKDRAREEREIA